jgi:cob(I)alamin adenosyltransferase
MATDSLSARIEMPREFVVPGESVAGAALDVARTIARRAERLAVGLHSDDAPVNPAILHYLNRLSSLLFVAARVEDALQGGTIRLAKSPTT